MKCWNQRHQKLAQIIVPTLRGKLVFLCLIRSTAWCDKNIPQIQCFSLMNPFISNLQNLKITSDIMNYQLTHIISMDFHPHLKQSLTILPGSFYTHNNALHLLLDSSFHISNTPEQTKYFCDPPQTSSPRPILTT